MTDGVRRKGASDSEITDRFHTVVTSTACNRHLPLFRRAERSIVIWT